MANIPSVLAYMNDIEIGNDKPVSTALLTKIGANINGILDDFSTIDSRLDAIETFVYNKTEIYLASSSGGPSTAINHTSNTGRILISLEPNSSSPTIGSQIYMTSGAWGFGLQSAMLSIRQDTIDIAKFGSLYVGNTSVVIGNSFNKIIDVGVGDTHSYDLVGSATSTATLIIHEMIFKIIDIPKVG